MATRLLGALVITSMGVSLPPVRILPVITRLVTVWIASAPPSAVTYFSRTWSTVAPGPAGGAVLGSVLAGISDSITGGTFTGWLAPRWQEKQVTCNWPWKAALLISEVMAIMARAVFFGPLSSASILPWTWQKLQSTPSDEAINCIAGITWSAGVPL